MSLLPTSVPIDLTVPWQITTRLSLKGELVGSTTLASAPVVALQSGVLTLGWSF